MLMYHRCAYNLMSQSLRSVFVLNCILLVLCPTLECINGKIWCSGSALFRTTQDRAVRVEVCVGGVVFVSLHVVFNVGCACARCCLGYQKYLKDL
jgi:hypothetical protein